MLLWTSCHYRFTEKPQRNAGLIFEPTLLTAVLKMITEEVFHIFLQLSIFYHSLELFPY